MLKTYRVKGTQTPFPIDMMLHDQCWPAAPEDVTKIQNSFGFRHGRRVRWEINVISENANSPDVARWRTFGVEVIRIEEIETFKERQIRERRGRR